MRYARCKAHYEWLVMVDTDDISRAKLRTTHKWEAEALRDHYLREKKFDVYIVKLTRVRYTLLED